ncbi:hypothetical protein ACYJW8_13810 [Frateuria aurantia]
MYRIAITARRAEGAFSTQARQRLEDNLGAADVLRAAAEIQIKGERYPEQLLKTASR